MNWIDSGEHVVVDVETQTTPTVNLKRMSTSEYAEHPQAPLLKLGLWTPEGGGRVFYRGGPQGEGLEAAAEFLERQSNRGHVFVAHNVLFDASVVRAQMGISFNDHFDTMDVLGYLGYGRSLANGARLLGREKLEPPPFDLRTLQSPHLREQLQRYVSCDVSLACGLLEEARQCRSLKPAEWRIMQHTANLRVNGLLVDGTRALELRREFIELRDAELAAFSTRYAFDTTALQAHQKVKHWIAGHFKVGLDSLDRRDPDLQEARSTVPGLGVFLNQRDRIRLLGMWADKLTRISGAQPRRLYGYIRYYGAGTGRFASGGRDVHRINLHGLPKRGEIAPEISRVRSIIVAPEGCGLVACDLSSIEPRIQALLAGQRDLLARFREGADVYTWFVGTVVGQDRALAYRPLGKEAMLGLGFGMGLDRFRERVRSTGLDNISDADIDAAFDRHRKLLKPMHDLRHGYMKAFRAASRNGRTTQAGMCTFRPLVPKNRTPGEGYGVTVELPTGRTLHYRCVAWRPAQMPWGELRDEAWFIRRVDYPSDPAKRFKGHERLGAHRLVENIVQAVARDVLMHQVLELEDLGIRVVFTVHDEVIAEAPGCTCNTSVRASGHRKTCSWRHTRDVVSEVMSSVPASLPLLADLPVACEISSEVLDAYGK